MRTLSIDALSAGYGEIAVVWDVNVWVDAGEVVTILGANGAGKSTVLATIARLLKPISGSIVIDGADTRDTPPHRLARSGVCLVPDDRSLLASLTVQESLSLVRNVEHDPLSLFPELVPLLGRRAGVLSGGEQQMLAMARALSVKPKLLLVDELSLGLAPMVVKRLLVAVRRAADEDGTAVLIVEQQVQQALAVSDRAYLMQHGRITFEGGADELIKRRSLIAASYLGEGPTA